MFPLDNKKKYFYLFNSLSMACILNKILLYKLFLCYCITLYCLFCLEESHCFRIGFGCLVRLQPRNTLLWRHCPIVTLPADRTSGSILSPGGKWKCGVPQIALLTRCAADVWWSNSDRNVKRSRKRAIFLVSFQVMTIARLFPLPSTKLDGTVRSLLDSFPVFRSTDFPNLHFYTLSGWRLWLQSDIFFVSPWLFVCVHRQCCSFPLHPCYDRRQGFPDCFGLQTHAASSQDGTC